MTFFISVILWLSLMLNQEYEIDTHLPVKVFVNKPLAVSGNIPSFIEVKLRGKGWDLMRVFTPFKLEYSYTLPDRKGEFSVNTRDYLSSSLGLSQKLTITYVYPESITFRTENYEEKYVKLVPRVTINCFDGYQVVGNLKLEPDSIKVGGAVDILRRLDTLYTKQYTFNNIKAPVFRKIEISDTLGNIILKFLDAVTLYANVELTAEKEFNNITVSVLNIPPDKDVLLIPQVLTVQLKGGVNQLASLDNRSLIASIDYRDVMADTTGALKPNFKLPEGCVITKVSPESIQYVIKKRS
ncbi:MAG: hypothetical protein N2510_08850 [Ignavibacteria bacterium]|nr:hypothetical protein [Ignavibacteria bacterium]